MLLNEIKQPTKIIKVKGVPDLSKLGEPIGSGAFAEVYEGKKPGTVIKHAVNDSSYFQFIQVALENQDNPFFPRIYNVKLYKVSSIDPKTRRVRTDIREGRQMLVEMEKLIPLRNDKVRDVVSHLVDQLGFEKEPYPNNLKHADERTKENIQLTRTLVFGTSTKEARNKLRERSQNPNFVEALDALENLFNRNMTDTTMDNWMIRPTMHGPQLVLTDPFAS